MTLPDGRALVTGGLSGGTTPATATTLATALYIAVMDDGTYKVSPGPMLAEARSGHAATVAVGTFPSYSADTAQEAFPSTASRRSTSPTG